MNDNSIESLPIIDFNDIVDTFGSEEQATMMLDMFDKLLRPRQELLNLLDAVLFENGKDIKFWAHKIKGAGGLVSAKRMKQLSEIVQNAGRDGKIDLAKEKFSDLIKMIMGAHRRALEILETPQEEIDKVIAETYELFLVYTKEKEPVEHFNLESLTENFGDPDLAFNMLVECLRPAFTEMNFFDRFYNALMQREFHELREAAHKLKGRCLYVCTPKMIEVSDQLKVAARERQEEECYKYLIDVIDESMFMEKYIMIKKLQVDEPREKWINLRPELVTLLENRDNIPGIIDQMRQTYEDNKNQKKEETPTKEGAQNGEGSSQHNEVGEIKIENQGEPVQEFKPIEEQRHSQVFHESQIKTVLEPIPEEKEKEEYKQNESSEDERKSQIKSVKSLASASKIELIKSPEKISQQKAFGSSDVNPPEEVKGEREELNKSKLGRSRTKNLEEIKESEEDSNNSANILRKSSSRLLTDPSENNRATEIKKQNNEPKENSAPLIIISSKKKKIKEEQVTDDDYPFDTGLKCTIF